MSYWQVVRNHEIHCGHRVYGHEGNCRHPHGHQYVFEFIVEKDTSTKENELDSVGRVIDFGQIKACLCGWLDVNWDHKFLVWIEDPARVLLHQIDPNGLVVLPCNPTVENLAQYFVEDIAPGLLLGTHTKLVGLRLWETSKCSAIYNVEGNAG